MLLLFQGECDQISRAKGSLESSFYKCSRPQSIHSNSKPKSFNGHCRIRDDYPTVPCPLFHNIPLHYTVYPPNGMGHFLREETRCQLLSHLGSTAFSVVPKNLTCTQWIPFSSLRKTFGFLHPTRAGLSLSPEDHCLSGSPQVEGQRKLGKYKRIVPTLKKKKKSQDHGILEQERILKTSSLTPHFINRYKENEVFSKMTY